MTICVVCSRQWHNEKTLIFPWLSPWICCCCFFFSFVLSFFRLTTDENRCQRKKLYRKRRKILEAMNVLVDDLLSFHWDRFCIRLSLFEWRAKKRVTKKKKRSNVWRKCKRMHLPSLNNVFEWNIREEKNDIATIIVMRKFVTRNRLFGVHKKCPSSFCVITVGFVVVVFN